MINAMVLLNEAGPLPLSVKFEAPSDGSVMFVLTGTAWTQEANSLIAVNLQLDGEDIGGTAMCFANQNMVHMTLRPTFIPVDSLAFGTHTLEIVPFNPQTIGDQNDYFQVTLFY